MTYTAESFSGFEHKAFDTFAEANAAARMMARTTGLPAKVYRVGQVLADVYNDDRGTVIR